MNDAEKEMQAPEKPGRREFTSLGVMAALSGVAVTISACSGGGGGGGGGTALDDSYDVPITGGSPVATDGIVGSISSNHGHTATITSAQLDGSAVVSLAIRGGATHDHSVDLTAEEVGQIGGGQRVVKRSSNTESHFHEVTFN